MQEANEEKAELEKRRERGEGFQLEDDIPTSAQDKDKGDVDFDDCGSFWRHTVSSMLPECLSGIRRDASEAISTKYIRDVRRYHFVKMKRRADYNDEGAIFTAPYLFFYLQCIICVITCAITFSQVDTANKTAWIIYTDYFGVIVNSGCPTTVFSLFKLSILEGRLETMKRFLRVQLWALVSVPILVLLPPFVTHVLPAMFLYFWILVPLISIAMNCYVAIGRRLVKVNDSHSDRTPHLKRYFFDFFVEIFVRFAIVFLLQTLYNYAVINYQGIMAGSPVSSYVNSFLVDYSLRTQTYCFFATVQKKSESLLLLFSFI